MKVHNAIKEVYKPGKDDPYYLKEIYIPLEELDEEWIWTVGEINEFDRLWKEKKTLKEIAQYFGRYETTILFVAFDRLMKRKIKPRAGWRLW